MRIGRASFIASSEPVIGWKIWRVEDSEERTRLRSVLYGISSTDLATLVTALAISTVCGACACLGPAMQVGRMDPVRAIRQE